ncbi:MAG: hypothetical protein KIT25_22730 [Enhydrobacter sp.]|nr:MAG: hypothetical protein KIT25_22730 [Enhydrobacter sp.]
MRRPVLVAIATLVFGCAAVYLGFIAWDSAQPRREFSVVVASAHIRGKVEPGDRTRFVQAFVQFARSEGFAPLPGTPEVPEADKKDVALEYARRDSMRLSMKLAPANDFTLLAFDQANSAAGGRLAERLVKMIESDFDATVRLE